MSKNVIQESTESTEKDPYRFESFSLSEVAKFAGCAKSTVVRYEKEGLIGGECRRTPRGFRRYTLQQKLLCKKIYYILNK